MTKDDIIVKKEKKKVDRNRNDATWYWREYILNSVTQSLQRRWKMRAERRDTFAGR